jgi:SAM-dependent methyltransferase
MRSLENLPAKLRELAKHHPSADVRRGANEAEIRRVAFHVGLAAKSSDGNVTVADIGGGIGLFSLGCAAVGMNTYLVDDFGDGVNARAGGDVLDYHRSLGVHVVKRDVVSEGIDFSDGFFDVITTFDSMEHWHASPKNLFRQVRSALRSGGTFVLGVPNCVNLRKRITVPLGLGKWSSMADWYEAPSFRGHVREPDVDDLRYIARDMSLTEVTVIGRNWQGYQSASRLARTLGAIADVPLRLHPAFCSDIYLLGRA